MRANLFFFFAKLACHLLVLDRFDWPRHASVHCSKQCHWLTLQHQEIPLEKILGNAVIRTGATGSIDPQAQMLPPCYATPYLGLPSYDWARLGLKKLWLAPSLKALTRFWSRFVTCQVFAQTQLREWLGRKIFFPANLNVFTTTLIIF